MEADSGQLVFIVPTTGNPAARFLPLQEKLGQIYMVPRLYPENDHQQTIPYPVGGGEAAYPFKPREAEGYFCSPQYSQQ